MKQISSFISHHSSLALKRSFTLIELLFVIAIIAILAGMLLPALNAARERARTTSCLGNIKSIATGITLYADDYNGYIVNAYPIAKGARFYWRHFLAPYVLNYKGPLYTSSGSFHGAVDKLARLAKGPYYCPSSNPPKTLTSDTAYDSVRNIFTYSMPLTDANDASKAKCPGNGWIKVTQIKGKSLSDQLVIGDVNDLGSNGKTDKTTLLSIWPNKGERGDPEQQRPPQRRRQHGLDGWPCRFPQAAGNDRQNR